MEPNVFDKVHEVDLKKTMEQSYIDYAMSVISARALPDVRDGLKPVQRRVLYSMIELNNGPDKPHRKCARIVGDTMGKYHPHGDSSIYGALVNMAQEWSTRYPLVDGHGNFGSVDGDGAAAMRYLSLIHILQVMMVWISLMALSRWFCRLASSSDSTSSNRRIGLSWISCFTSSSSDSFKDRAAVRCCPWEPNLRISMPFTKKLMSSLCGPQSVVFCFMSWGLLRFMDSSNSSQSVSGS